MRAVWLMGDQLHVGHPAFAKLDRRTDQVVMIESRKRSEQVTYHQIKLVMIFAAMRHRAEAFRREGWKVHYVELTDDYLTGLQAFVSECQPTTLLIQEPSQYNFVQGMPALSRKLGVPIEMLSENSFLLSRHDFSHWAKGSKRPLMENHYRKMRRDLNILMEEDGTPTGGEWNYDKDNREPYSSLARKRPPLPKVGPVPPDETTREVIAMVKREFPKHPGDAADFWLPVTREGALAWLDDFIERRLANFGPWEDVMAEGEPVLFHSVLSPLLNVGLLHPRECVDAAVAAYKSGQAPLASVEGFVRQIIGWREFIHGVYWHRMPGYEKLNALNAQRKLPAWIYTGETEMNCLHHAITQVVKMAYNHHIQRLMVLGNFFLLGGFQPAAVLRWYTEMYVDAQDWVMAPNVLGMILQADGGYMATKPYAAGAGYIHKMSNYCEGCHYDPEKRTGPDACPFNYLYWNFYAEHEERFARNPRVSMMLKTWHKKSAEEQAEIRRAAKAFLDALPVEESLSEK